MNWRSMETPPADGQECLVKMKHGYIDGCYSDTDGAFVSYKFKDIYFFGQMWVPIEEVECKH